MEKITVLLLSLFFWCNTASATDITYADKSAGGTFTHTDANEIKTAVNTKRDRQSSTYYMTADHTFTAAEFLSNDFVSNYGATGKVHAYLPAVSYNIVRTFLVEAAQIIEIVPPSGEQLYYQGTALTADYVIDSPATLGSMAVVTRIKTGASTWSWNVGVAQGTWSNPGRVRD